MADSEVGGLTAAGTLDGTELAHVVQSGNSRKTTVKEIANLAVPVTEQIGTTYTFDIDDANTVVEFNNASAITATIPANASVAYPIGTFIEIHQTGAGVVTVAITSDTLVSRDSLTNTAGQEAVVGVRKVAATKWRLTGDLA